RLGLGRLGRLLGLGLRLRNRLDRRRGAPTQLVLPHLAHTRLLADTSAQVVELRAVDVADRADLDLLDLRRVERERPLDADAEGLLAYGERLARSGPLALDHDALVDLDPPALALDHLKVDAHGVPRLEAWD